MLPARSAFTLMELLVTMLLIMTIMAFGVPALFSSERKAAVGDGIRNLVNLHERAMRNTRLAAVTFSSGTATSIYSITFASTTTAPTASLEGTTLNNVSINGDGAVTTLTGATTLYYNPPTGLPANSATDSSAWTAPKIFTFATANNKYARKLKIYPLGFTEDIQ
jgi:type II secretory pathway pseudopilin PulG